MLPHLPCRAVGDCALGDRKLEPSSALPAVIRSAHHSCPQDPISGEFQVAKVFQPAVALLLGAVRNDLLKVCTPRLREQTPPSDFLSPARSGAVFDKTIGRIAREQRLSPSSAFTQRSINWLPKPDFRSLPIVSLIRSPCFIAAAKELARLVEIIS
jgi:hypothetical protein